MRVVARVEDEDLRGHVGRHRASTVLHVCFLIHVIVLLAVVAGCRSTNPRMGDVESADTRRTAPPPRTTKELEHDRKEALRLFDEGRRLVIAGDPAAACPVFEKSRDLDPGAGTLYHLADCYVRIGKTASAYELFKEVVDLSKKANRPDREKLASDRMKALEPQLSRLTIHVPWVTPSTPLIVYRDRTIVPRSQWGRDIPIDPGIHKLEANMQGFVPWKDIVGIDRSSAHVIVRIPNLAPQPTERRSGAMMGIGIFLIVPSSMGVLVGGAIAIFETGAGMLIIGGSLVGMGGGIAMTVLGSQMVPVKQRSSAQTDVHFHVGPGSIGFSGTF